MKAVGAALLMAVGLVGLYFKVEYAGWALFAGLLVALDS